MITVRHSFGVVQGAEQVQRRIGISGDRIRIQFFNQPDPGRGTAHLLRWHNQFLKIQCVLLTCINLVASQLTGFVNGDVVGGVSQMHQVVITHFQGLNAKDLQYTIFGNIHNALAGFLDISRRISFYFVVEW